MYFVNIDDFYNKVSVYKKLSRDDEKLLHSKMKEGDMAAREQLINSYMPLIAINVKRLNNEYQSLELVYRCIQSLEKCVDSFNFQQDGESFAHRFNWYYRQTITRYIVDSREGAK